MMLARLLQSHETLHVSMIVLVKFVVINKNQPEETDKRCRQINSQKGTL